MYETDPFVILSNICTFGLNWLVTHPIKVCDNRMAKTKSYMWTEYIDKLATRWTKTQNWREYKRIRDQMVQALEQVIY